MGTQIDNPCLQWLLDKVPDSGQSWSVHANELKVMLFNAGFSSRDLIDVIAHQSSLAVDWQPAAFEPLSCYVFTRKGGSQ